jgi:hypothetical protein
LGRTRAQVQQTELAALTGPAVRRKARFLKVGPILRFAQLVLRLLEGGEEGLREKVKQKAGLAYGSRGWLVFPVHGIVAGRCTCGKPDCNRAGKHPRTEHGLKDAGTDPRLIRSW